MILHTAFYWILRSKCIVYIKVPIVIKQTPSLPEGEGVCFDHYRDLGLHNM